MRPGLRRWHRRFGIFAALFLSWLALSGIALNHGHFLGLDRAHISSHWLLALYQLDASPASGFAADGHRLVGTQLDGKTLQPPVDQAIGLAAASGMLFVATPSSLVLLSPTGDRIEELRPPTLPVPTLRRIGVLDGKLIIDGGEGRLFTSADGEAWNATSADGATWSEPQAVPDASTQASVTAEQALLDAHSGHLFGRFGPLFVDLVALSALVLAVTGTLVWWKSRAPAVRN